MNNRDEKLVGKAALALAGAALVLSPAIGIAAARDARPPAISLSFDRISDFTPAGADPRLAAMFANRSSPFSDFKFTPAAAKGRPSQVRVALRAGAGQSLDRSVGAVAAASMTALAPSKYDLGVSVGWKRLGVSGDVGRVSSADPLIGTRETAIVGVSYNLNKFSGRLAVSGERNDSRIAQFTRPNNVAFDLGASYNVSRNIALNGGVRYKIEKDQIPALVDDRREDKAVYVGTAFKF